MNKILINKESSDWISNAQIFACFIPSVLSLIRSKYIYLLIKEIINGLFIFDSYKDDNNNDIIDTQNGICAQSRYCILEYLYFEPNIILPLIINKIIPHLYYDNIYDRLGTVELIWDILCSINNIKYNNNNNNNIYNNNNYSLLNLEKNKENY